jgi:ankyrin repeat protein
MAEPALKDKFEQVMIDFVTAASLGSLESVSSILSGHGPSILSKSDLNHFTAMGAAAREGQNEILEFLLEKGADVNVRDVDGYTPLMEAAFSGQSKTVALLLKAGAQITPVAKNRDTALTVVKIYANGDGDYNKNGDYKGVIEQLTAVQEMLDLEADIASFSPGLKTPVRACQPILLKPQVLK